MNLSGLILTISLCLYHLNGRIYTFQRSSNPIYYSDGECNTTVIWMSSNEANDIHKLSLHNELCRALPKDVLSVKSMPLDDSIINNQVGDGLFSLINFYDLNYLLNVGSLQKLTEKQTRFFLIREAIGSFRIIAMIYDNRNLRLNLIDPEVTKSAIKPNQIACISSDCPFYRGNNSCFLPNIGERLKISEFSSQSLFPNKSQDENSSRLTIYQVQAIVLGFLCIVFALACVLFCIYAFKSTKYSNVANNNSKLLVNNLKPSPSLLYRTQNESVENYLNMPKSNSIAVLKTLNQHNFDDFGNLYQQLDNRRIIKPVESTGDCYVSRTLNQPTLVSFPSSKSMQFNSQQTSTVGRLQRPKSIMKMHADHMNEITGKDFSLLSWPENKDFDDRT